MTSKAIRTNHGCASGGSTRTTRPSGEPVGTPLIDCEYADEKGLLKSRLRIYRSQRDELYLVRLCAWPLRPEDRTDWSYLEVRTSCLNKRNVHRWLGFGASIALWMFAEADEDWHDTVERMTTDLLRHLRDLPDDER